MVSQPRWGNGSKGRLLSISGAGFCAIETDWQNQFDGLRLLGQDYRRGGLVVPEFLRTLVFARPRGDDQFADGTFSPSLDKSR